MKKTLTLVGIIVLTIVLAVLSVVTAIKIRDLGTRPVAPSVPESKPKAEEVWPPDNAIPEPVCKTSLSVGATAVQVTCSEKKAYRNDSRNTEERYYLEDQIGEGETVNPGEIIVFSINLSSGDKEVVVTDTLPSTLEFVDTSTPNCSYEGGILTCLLPNSLIAPAFRAKVKSNAEGTITNTAGAAPTGDPPSTCSVAVEVATEEITETPTPTITGAPGSMCEYLHADKTSGKVPLTVAFEGKGFDPTRVKGFRFTFGDGEKKEVLGSFTSEHTESISHTYSKVGTYQAVLEILDDGDNWKTRPECKLTVKGTSEGVTPTETAEGPTPSEIELPKAGLKIPTLGGIIAGFLLISLGAALIF
jgi:hypothetical protein